MRMEKIKVNKDKSLSFDFLIILEEKPGDEKDIYLKTHFKSNRSAQKEFYDSLAELKHYVVNMCELPSDDLRRIKVTGVTFTHTKANIMGAQILAERQLNHAEIGTDLVTPHRTAAPYNDDDADQELLTAECQTALQNLIEAAEDYLAGHKDQIGLFNGKAVNETG